MCIHMAKTIQEERLRWILPVVRKGARIVDVAKICPHSLRSLKRWLKRYRVEGDKGLVPQSTKPKVHPRETPIRVKERVITLRKKTKLCAKKLKWRLAKQGIHLHERTIGKILKAEKLTRIYRSRRMRYKYIPVQRQPGELLEIDVKYVPGRVENKRFYQYTAIDTASRWRYLDIFEEQSNFHSVIFLERVMKRFSRPILAVKTDNGFVFTNRYTGTYKREDFSPRQLHAFDRFCAEHKIIHYLIDPGKPAQNGTVERSHREDQEKFYNQIKFKNTRDLKRKIRIWNNIYNNLEHCSLNGKTPNEMLKSFNP